MSIGVIQKETKTKSLNRIKIYTVKLKDNI